MLYYLLFWTILGFIFHFYIIFGTNLLNQSLVPVSVFPLFRVSQKRNIKRSPNRMKPSGAIFLEQTWSRGLGVDVKQQRRRPRGCPARPPTSWPSGSFSYVGSKSPGSCSFQKSRSWRFHSVWTPFDIPFLRNTEIGNKTTIWAGAPVNRFSTKNDINV